MTIKTTLKKPSLIRVKLLSTAFVLSMQLSEYKIVIKFPSFKDPLAVEENSYLSKIVNAYMVNDLDDWPRNQ